MMQRPHVTFSDENIDNETIFSLSTINVPLLNSIHESPLWNPELLLYYRVSCVLQNPLSEVQFLQALAADSGSLPYVILPLPAVAKIACYTLHREKRNSGIAKDAHLMTKHDPPTDG